MQHVDSTDGVRLAVHDLGGRGRTILFAHATGFHAIVWRPLAQHLASRFHSVALDYRGHGASTSPASGDFNWRGMCADTLAVIDALGLERPVAVGHSMGGGALVMAEEERPGTFAGLALFEPILIPPDRPMPEGELPIVAGARRRRAEFPNRLEAFENYASKPPLNVLTREALAAYVEHGFVDTDHGTVRLACEPEHEARVFEGSRVPGVWEGLGSIRCPVLLLSGREEAFQPSSYTASVAAQIPGAALQRFGHLGHFGPLEEPDVVGDAIAGYFASL